MATLHRQTLAAVRSRDVFGNDRESRSEGQRCQLPYACMVQNHHKQPRIQNNTRTKHQRMGTVQVVLNAFSQFPSVIFSTSICYSLNIHLLFSQLPSAILSISICHFLNISGGSGRQKPSAIGQEIGRSRGDNQKTCAILGPITLCHFSE